MKILEFLEEQLSLFLHLMPGDDLFGKIHIFPRIGCIGMEFFHLSFIPILPQGCYISLEESERYHAARFRIRLRMASLLQVWFRTICFVIPICYGLIIFWKWLEESEGFPDAPPASVSRLPFLLFLVGVGGLLFTGSLQIPRPDLNALRIAIEEADMPEDRKQDVLRRIERIEAK